MKSDLAQLQIRVRVVARALGRHRLATAWGHCSARVGDEHFLVCAPRPMGVIKPGEDGTVVAIREPLPAGVLGEVRIHQQVYRRRPEVGGVCRFFAPTAVALSTQRIVAHPRHGVGAYVAGTAFWDDVRLLRDDALAAQLAAHMGDAGALILRGNGAVTAGATIETALALAYCLEEAAQVELIVRNTAADPEEELVRFDLDEVSARQVTSGAIFERLWDFLTDGDPEAAPLSARELFGA
jgi:HCOMODA/2-hydroxy-3-carboxy-muconic semialdehyde decarboxylase